MNLAKEVMATEKEIVVEEKIHITETEELIVEEIPETVKEMFVTKVENDGKDFIEFIFSPFHYRVIPFYLLTPLTPFPKCLIETKTIGKS